MNYQNNIVTVKVGLLDSSGYAFKSVCGKSKYVITSKHSICEDKPSCLYISEGNNACRTCQLYVNISQVKIKFGDNNLIDICNYFLSDKSDVAILELESERTDLDLLKCSFSDANEYYIWKYNKDSLILDSKRIKEESYALYNLKSPTFTEFLPKSKVIPGYSGTPVFSIDEKGRPLIHSILTDNESNNDIGAEIITRELLHELSLKSSVIINSDFSLLSHDINNTFIEDCFEFYYEQELENENKLKVYSLPFTDSNKFDLSKVVDLLTSNMTRSVFSPREVELAKGNDMKVFQAFSTFLSEPTDKYSKPALLQNLIESDLSAPTLYKSTKQDDFSSIHVREFFPEQFEFIMTKFFSDTELIEAISNCVNSIKEANNKISGSSLLLDQQFVSQSLSVKYADLISKLVLPDNDTHIEYNFGLLSTYIVDIDPSIYRERVLNNKRCAVKDRIIEHLNDKYEKISSIFNDNFFMGKTCYLYLIPINETGELKKLMYAKINQGNNG
ncbi:Hachiman antiphage defense system protein HamA [uncultured Photobacterium sp.]|uniref:Hachiman antiphage defense system protein HamA n=1 Tax=uncultured Photobacterium sp. TaxID=173973 RepID=UPI002603B1D7|nr:Hachiman antiphage defense system protein HamA [uncultured Photobacterium sp.]